MGEMKQRSRVIRVMREEAKGLKELKGRGEALGEQEQGGESAQVATWAFVSNPEDHFRWLLKITNLSAALTMNPCGPAPR